MHPLTEKLFGKDYGGRNNLVTLQYDKLITQYLQERAGWLKDQELNYGMLSGKQINQAFELSPKEEDISKKVFNSLPDSSLGIRQKIYLKEIEKYCSCKEPELCRAMYSDNLDRCHKCHKILTPTEPKLPEKIAITFTEKLSLSLYEQKILDRLNELIDYLSTKK